MQEMPFLLTSTRRCGLSTCQILASDPVGLCGGGWDLNSSLSDKHHVTSRLLPSQMACLPSSQLVQLSETQKAVQISMDKINGSQHLEDFMLPEKVGSRGKRPLLVRICVAP